MCERLALSLKTIDPIKLKAASEHLEWVCQQYPNEERVQSLLQGLQRMIDDAKAGRLLEPIAEGQRRPFQWAVSAEGLYRDHRDPNIEGAYCEFADEIEGGLTEQDRRILAGFAARVAAESSESGEIS